MTAPVFARWAARVLEGEDPRGSGDGTVSPLDRAAAIGAIERALLAKGRRRTRARWAMGLSLAASVALAAGLAGFAAHEREGAAPVTAAAQAPRATEALPTEGAATTPAPAKAPQKLTIVGHVTGTGATIGNRTGALKEGDAVGPGNRVVARGTSHALLAFSTGTELSVEPSAFGDGDMTILEEGRSQVFALDTGAVRAHVAKLHAGERFVVHTPDAEVEVRGTSFRVAIAPPDSSCGAGTVTRVSVDEGVVVVRHGQIESRVARGETWPPGCDADTKPPIELPPIELADNPSNPLARAPKPSGYLGDTPKPPGYLGDTPKPPGYLGDTPKPPREHRPLTSLTPSSLADQNDAFAEALALKNGGQDDAAALAFERFVARYPSSNLAESAAVERMKLLLVTDRARGVAAAAQYLRRYPNGFAQADARAAVAGNR
jgi:hypothetical protein